MQDFARLPAVVLHTPKAAGCTHVRWRIAVVPRQVNLVKFLAHAKFAIAARFAHACVFEPNHATLGGVAMRDRTTGRCSGQVATRAFATRLGHRCTAVLGFCVDTERNATSAFHALVCVTTNKEKVKEVNRLGVVRFFLLFLLTLLFFSFPKNNDAWHFCLSLLFAYPVDASGVVPCVDGNFGSSNQPEVLSMKCGVRAVVKMIFFYFL